MHRLKRAFVSVFTIIIAPLFLLDILKKWIRKPAYRLECATRFFPRVNGPFDLWIHAVSVGEARCAVFVRRQFRDKRVLITTSTPTGREIVLNEGLKEGDAHAYLPVDIFWCMNAFVRKAQCSTLVVIETELWPHLLWAASDAGMNIFIVNARMSQRSFKRYWKTRWLWSALAMTLNNVYPESVLSRERFKALGFPVSNQIPYNIKYLFEKELIKDDAHVQNWKKMRKGPIIVIACTHPGEEQLMWNAWKQSKWRHGCCVIIPRHPERALGLMKTFEGASLVSQLKDTQSVIENRLGYVHQWYSVADLVLLGGSFAAHGGHNPLEAAPYAVPIVVGPHTYNFQTIYQELLQAEAVRESSREDLLQVLEHFFDNRDDMRAMGLRLEEHWKHVQRKAIKQVTNMLKEIDSTMAIVA